MGKCFIHDIFRGLWRRFFFAQNYPIPVFCYKKQVILTKTLQMRLLKCLFIIISFGIPQLEWGNVLCTIFLRGSWRRFFFGQNYPLPVFCSKKTSDFNQDFANAIAQMFIHYHQLQDPLDRMGKCFIHDIFRGLWRRFFFAQNYPIPVFCYKKQVILTKTLQMRLLKCLFIIISFGIPQLEWGNVLCTIFLRGLWRRFHGISGFSHNSV